MDRVWTWSGRGIGYRDRDVIWARSGRYIGAVCDNEVYDRNGRYVGEFVRGRLVTKVRKKSIIRHDYKCNVTQVGRVLPQHGRFDDDMGYVMLVGYEDFPRYGD